MVTNQPNYLRQTSEQRYRHLFEYAPICIFVANLAAVPAPILEANWRAELVNGYAAAELVGMPATQLAPSGVRMWIRLRAVLTTTAKTRKQNARREPR